MRFAHLALANVCDAAIRKDPNGPGDGKSPMERLNLKVGDMAIVDSSPTSITLTRRFTAPPERVFAAHTEPALIQRWCYGFEGWRMPVCINDARPGGELRRGPLAPGSSGRQ